MMTDADAQQVETELPVDGDAPATTVDPVAALEADVLKWKELAMRTAAEFDNFRKRMAREREDTSRFAKQELLEDLLPVLDNFEMGMQAAAKDQGSMIYIGMDMVRRQLNDFLSAQGAEEMQAEGQDFDPNLHEAVSQEVVDGVAEGKIVRVIRRGFRLRERLLRPASVVVAKSAAEPQPKGDA